MAGSQITVAITRLETGQIGKQAISLTNYDADTEPQIAAGSTVEIAGALFEFSAPESITGWAGIALSTAAWIKLVVSGTSVTAEFTDTAPTWSISKQGFYDGLDRYVAQLYKDASGNYAYKFVFGGLSPGGNPIRRVGVPYPSPVKFVPGALWCDGSTISNVSNPEYSRLVYLLKREAGADAAHPFYHADADKAKLPDLRGVVIRGIDAAAHYDKDGVRKAGGYQADLVGNHTHPMGSHTHDIHLPSTGAMQGTAQVTAHGTASPSYGNGTIVATALGSTGNPDTGGAAETVVKNAALYYLVDF